MSDTHAFYRFSMTFTPANGDPPISRSLDAVNMLLLLDAIRRRDQRMGRPSTARAIKLKHMLHARDQIRENGDPVTQEGLSLKLGYESDRSIRRWLKDLGLTWEEFLLMDDF